MGGTNWSILKVQKIYKIRRCSQLLNNNTPSNTLHRPPDTLAWLVEVYRNDSLFFYVLVIIKRDLYTMYKWGFCFNYVRPAFYYFVPLTLYHKNRDIKVGSSDRISINGPQRYIKNMTTEALPGRPETLTTEQESKLKDLWATTLHLFGVLNDKSANDDTDNSRPRSDTTNSKKPRKKRTTLFRKNKDEGNSSATFSTLSEADDKFGQMKVFNEALANMTPESLRNSFWGMVKHDNPDALLLRFLRARQWDIEKALVMVISTMRWRLNEVHVDDDIILNGDLKALEQSNGSDPVQKKFGKNFLDQMRLGKSFLHGTDKKGRPMCLVRVRQHKVGEQCEQSLERYTVYLIETARMVLAPPIDTAVNHHFCQKIYLLINFQTVVFDMTGFSMANMDYTPVKFMIKCFEANYPECLGVILVHKAPWIFQGLLWPMV